MPAVILLIERTEARVESLAPILESAAYEVQRAQGIEMALVICEKLAPMLVVIDWSGLLEGPDESDSGPRSELSRRLSGVPILYVGWPSELKNEVGESVIVLRRPITRRKLLNQVRRYVPATRREENVLKAADLSLNLDRRVLTIAHRKVEYLTPKLAILLETLLCRPNEVVSRTELMRDVWDTDYTGDTRTLDVHVRWLRQIIEENPSRPERLLTVRGIGYKLKLP